MGKSPLNLLIHIPEFMVSILYKIYKSIKTTTGTKTPIDLF